MHFHVGFFLLSLSLYLSYVLRSLLYRGLRLLQLQSFLTFVRARLIHFVAILIYPLIKSYSLIQYMCIFYIVLRYSN